MSMTLRERLLTTLRGGVPDRIPWNIYAWLLPDTEAARSLCRKGLGLMGTRRIFRKIHEGLTIREERKDVLREGAPGGRLVIGCTEDFPVSQFEKTFTAIGRALAEYEGYEW